MNEIKEAYLSQVWHNIIEIPNTHYRIVVLHKYKEGLVVWHIDTFCWCVAYFGDWAEYANGNHIISWAYTKDLLPISGDVILKDDGKWNTSYLWHKATERPDGHHLYMVLHKAHGKEAEMLPPNIANLVCMHNSNWDEYVKANHIIAWAYIKDLLPKEYEE